MIESNYGCCRHDNNWSVYYDCGETFSYNTIFSYGCTYDCPSPDDCTVSLAWVFAIIAIIVFCICVGICNQMAK